MKDLRFLFLSLGMVLFAACGDGGGSSDAGTDEGGPSECIGCGAPYEASFVISKLNIGTVNQGFNLDGKNTQPSSPECKEGTCILDGNNGVDNRLSEILTAVENEVGESFNADEEINKNISEGDMLVVLRLLDVEVNPMSGITKTDPDIVMKGYLGLDTDDPEDASDNLSGQEPMDVDSRSLNNPSDIDASLIDFQNCYISAGKLRCEPSVFHLELEIEENPLELVIHEAQLVASIDGDPADNGGGVYLGGSMKEGILGGYVPITYLQDTLEEFASELGDISPSTIQQILANHADIDAIEEGPTDVSCPNGAEDCLIWQQCRDGVCHEPANQNDSISLAVTFELVSVEFTGEIVTPE